MHIIQNKKTNSIALPDYRIGMVRDLILSLADGDFIAQDSLGQRYHIDLNFIEFLVFGGTVIQLDAFLTGAIDAQGHITSKEPYLRRVAWNIARKRYSK